MKNENQFQWNLLFSFLMIWILSYAFLAFLNYYFHLKQANSFVLSNRNAILRNNFFEVGNSALSFQKDSFEEIYFQKDDRVVFGENQKIHSYWNILFKSISIKVFQDIENKVFVGVLYFQYNDTISLLLSLVFSCVIFSLFAWLSFREKKLHELALMKENELINQRNLIRLSRQVAHDIRSPLMVLDSAIKNEQLENRSHFIQKSLANIYSIAERLLKKESKVDHWGEMILVKKFLQEFVISKEVESQKKFITLKFDEESHTDFDRLLIFTNRVNLERMFSNLINNSLQACNDTEVTIILKHNLDSLEIIIRDNGPGFPDELMKSFGKTEKTTKKEGYGIGIFSAIEFVKSWKGNIDFSNQSGAIVKLRFQTMNHWQFFFIDDDELNRMIWDSEFKKLKINYQTFPGVSEDFCKKLVLSPSVVYLDSYLQDQLRGEDFIDLILSHRPQEEIKIIMASGNDKEHFLNNSHPSLKYISGVCSKKPDWLI